MEARTPLTLEVWVPSHVQDAVADAKLEEADTHAVANPALGAMSSSPVAIVTPALSQPPRALSDSTNMDPAQRAALRTAHPSHAHGPCTAVAAPGAPRQPQQLDGSTEHEPRPPTAENPNDRLGVVPKHAEKFPVEEGSDHIVLAFFRLGQFWEKAEVAAKPPLDCSRATVDIEEGAPCLAPWKFQEQHALYGSYIITPAGNDKLIRLPKLFAADETPRGPSSFRFKSIGCDMSVTPTGEDLNLLALWRKDKPFYQKWSSVKILATPVVHGDADEADDDDTAAAAAADFQMSVNTVRIEWFELLRAFLIALVVLLMQTMASYLVYKNSMSVNVDDVAESIQGGFISFAEEDHKCDTSFQCAEEFKASQQRYTLEIHDLFHGPNSVVCLTIDGYSNAVFNIMLGTFIIQILVIRDAHMFWTLAPFDMATHTHLDKARWAGFLVLFLIMLANYMYIVIACFYGILGAAEDFAALLGACTTAFVLLEVDDVVYKLTAAKFFRAEHSARPGSAACHAVDFYRHHLDFKWSDCCSELPKTKRCEAVGNRVGVFVIAASTNVVLAVTIIGPWMPMFLHSFWYEHGFLHNTICPAE